MPRSVLSARASILMCTLVVGACQTAAPNSPSRAAPADTRVVVRNDHWESLTIYVERDGLRSRLGAVEGNTSRVMKIQDDLLGLGGWVQLIGVETGRRDHVRSEFFTIRRGDRAAWRTGPTDHLTPVVVTPAG